MLQVVGRRPLYTYDVHVYIYKPVIGGLTGRLHVHTITITIIIILFILIIIIILTLTHDFVLNITLCS